MEQLNSLRHICGNPYSAGLVDGATDDADWFRAPWQITSQKNGISTLGLPRVLGLGSYKTVWTILHKLRQEARFKLTAGPPIWD